MTGGFLYDALPMRVQFGSGRLAVLPDEVRRLERERVLVLSTPGGRHLADRVAALLGDRVVGVFDQARMHVPADTVRAAVQVAEECAADAGVAIGGGSTIGLAKALALRLGLPCVAVPTTYAGSEMTPIWGVTEQARKTTGRDLVVLPRSVVYDPDLTLTLPPRVAGTSGLNAIAHAVEALYAPDGSPVVAAMAEQGVRDLAGALPRIVRDPDDVQARGCALQGAWLCGACLGATTMGLHHKLCHVLGGMLDLPHADTHAVVLPRVAAYNLDEAPAARAALTRALGRSDPAVALADLAAAVGAPAGLRDLGVAESDLDRVVAEVLAHPYSNPRPVDGTVLHRILLAAWSGDIRW